MTVESLTTPQATPAHDEPAVGLLSRAHDAPAQRVQITGLGLLTPLGHTADQTWDALLAGRYITDHARAAGEFDPGAPRVIQMARRAADQARAQAGWSIDDGFATVVGTSKGSVESWLTSASNGAGESQPPVQFPETTGLADIASALGGCGPKLTVSAACASGLLALIRAAMMIRSGEARRVLVVAAEASVHPLFLGSFKRLGVLPAPGIGCRPFDETRDGFLMSEAAAAICLEASWPTRPDRGIGNPSEGASDVPRVAIDRFAMAADASHLTAADPAGRVLTHLINKVTLGARVDLVHAHGTGTVANDPTELAAIDAAAAARHRPPAALYSHKAALGHSLGAAGLVSIALNVLAHHRGTIPPNVRTTRPLPCRAATIDPDAQHRPVHRSLSLAAGFGGAMAAVGLVTV
jgi:3-oxoacyl-[acyl-carrier-protein] synthase II